MTTALAEETLTIRPLIIAEISQCVDGAVLFHREFNMPGTLVPAVFTRNWTAFLTTMTARIFSAWRGPDLVGGLGALAHPDLNDGRIVATEMFWFVMPHERERPGSMTAVRLLKTFMQWGDAQAVETRLAHMMGGAHDAQLDRLYRKLGYKPLEMGYFRPRQERRSR